MLIAGCAGVASLEGPTTGREGGRKRLTAQMFDVMVKDNRMPKPTRINTRMVWDRIKLDEAFAALSDDDRNDDPWDKVAV